LKRSHLTSPRLYGRTELNTVIRNTQRKRGTKRKKKTRSAYKLTTSNNQTKTMLRKPEWLKININTSDSYKRLKKLMREKKLNTVCEEAKCPNLHECWSERQTATFMILGDTCTRG